MIDKTNPFELPPFTFAYLVKTKDKEYIFTEKHKAIQKANLFFGMDIYPTIIPLQTQSPESAKYIQFAQRFGFSQGKIIWLVNRILEQFYCLEFLGFIKPAFEDNSSDKDYYIQLRFGKITNDKIEWNPNIEKRTLTKTPNGLQFNFEGLNLYLRDFQSQLIKY